MVVWDAGVVSGSLRWLGQAGFIMETPDVRVGVDLFLRADPRLRPPFQHPDQLGPLDAVLATHEHHDHLDAFTVVTLQQRLPELRVIVPEPVTALASELGILGVEGARVGVPIAVGDITITPIRALHAVHMDEGYHFGDPEGRFLGYIFDVGGVRVYHSGDTVMYPGLSAALRDFQVTILCCPINGRSFHRESADLVGNFTPEEAVELAREVGAAALIPMHFETYPNNLGDVGQAADLAYKAGVTFVLPRYGQAVPLLW